MRLYSFGLYFSVNGIFSLLYISLLHKQKEEYLNKMSYSDTEKEIAMTAILGGCRKYSDYKRKVK